MHNKMWKTAAIFLLLACFVHVSQQHGYMADPAQRSSLWRFNYNGAVENYNDMGLFCGGKAVQWQVNEGRCGVCGDAYNKPRENEAGGKYAKEIIAKTYTKGEIITVKIQLTANHRGWFQFKICPHNDWNTRVNQTCLDNNVLDLPDEGSKKYYLNTGRHNIGIYEIRVQLPDDMTCSQCVLQWRYVTGNDWGCDGTHCCVGCALTGQETFVNCADIAIVSTDGSLPSPTSSPGKTSTTSSMTSSAIPTMPSILSSILIPTTTQIATESPIASQDFNPANCILPLFSCTGVGAWANSDMANWCYVNCVAGFCPRSHCYCECE